MTDLADADPQLRKRLHDAWLLELRMEWRSANDVHLDGALQPPALTIATDASIQLGLWERAPRLIRISEAHIWRDPWHTVVDTLRHEMAHQYVDEVLHARDQTAHGPAFAATCRRLHVSPRATGNRPTGARCVADKVLQKVRKLLALAGSSNVHEAERAMAAANRLLLEYNLELTGSATLPEYGHRIIGRSAAALPVEWKLVAALLTEFFFVECIWVTVYNAHRLRHERQLELVGSDANLDLAHYVHDYLHTACERLWHGARAELASGSRYQRSEYLAGVLTGFRDKLRAERSAAASHGLVWRGDPGVERHLRARHPHVRSLYGGGVRRGEAHAAGVEAGRELTIHRGLHETGARGRLLGKG
jgi:hypothetical protein